MPVHDDLRFRFEDLSDADLVVDAVYAGRGSGSVADDPIARLLPVGNLGGFRFRGSVRAGSVRLVVLYTTGTEPDWPDRLDPQSGTFTYYGDNRRHGRDLHSTSGNQLLRDVFNATHGSAGGRERVPVFLLFEKLPAGGRDVRFRGLLAPGATGVSPDEDLTAIWRTTKGVRFQNYRAMLTTVLDVSTVPRYWIDRIVAGDVLGPACPGPWHRWVHGRRYDAIVAPFHDVDPREGGSGSF